MELKQNNMKKGPYKMKYTNGKKADTSAFPFKESPAKFVGSTSLDPAMFAKGPGETPVAGSKGSNVQAHTHTQDFIVD